MSLAGRRIPEGTPEWEEAERRLAHLQEPGAYRPPISDGDMIDFKCSPAFRNYFYEMGLTPQPAITPEHQGSSPRGSESSDSPKADEMEALRDELRVLRSQLQRAGREIAELKRGGSQRPPQQSPRPANTGQLTDFNQVLGGS